MKKVPPSLAERKAVRQIQTLHTAENDFRREVIRVRNFQPCGGGFRIIRKRLEK